MQKANSGPFYWADRYSIDLLKSGGTKSLNRMGFEPEMVQVLLKLSLED